MSRHLDVLILEDSAQDAELLVRELRRAGFDPDWRRVETRTGFLAALDACPDLVLSDYSLPQFDGLRAVMALRERGLDIPFILISGTVGEDLAVEAIRHGATDYLLKDRITRLGPAVQRALEGKRSRDRQREAEEERRRSDERFRASAEIQKAILNALPAHLALIDPDGWIVAVNEAWRDFAAANGLEAADGGVGMNYLDACDRAVGEQAAQGRAAADGIRRVLRGEAREHAMEYPCHSPTEQRWFRMIVTPLREGQSAGAVVMHLNITARKLADAALRQSEERFRELAETIDEVFWITDPNKRLVLYVSPAYERIWGRSCRSLCDGRHAWTDAVHAEDRERVRHAAATRQAHGTYDEEYRIVRADGEVRWIRDRAYPVHNAAGHIERIVGVAEDITARKQAQEELHASERRFRLLIENASDLISVINREGLIRFQSPSVLRVLGYRPEDLMGRIKFDLIHPDDVPAAVSLIERVQSHPDDAASAEYRFRTRDGGWRTLQTVGRSIPDEAEDGFIVLNSRDITDSRRVEEQFRQSQKREAIGQLAGGIAHDFNNILAAMMMQAELTLMEHRLSESAREGLREIRLAAERASRLTRQLLLYSRREVMQPCNLDLNDAITSLARMLQRIIGEDVHLHLRLHPTPLMVRADVGMLDQVVMNLVVNARDAMPEGGRLVLESGEKCVDKEFARFNPDAAPGRYAWLSVSDTGRGIPAEVLPRIFDPFFTTKEPGKGTGLGLATVFGIVKQHQGWISVASEPGRGAEFRVFLPASVAPSIPEASDAIHPLPEGGTETILLVEDEPTVRSLTRVVLERHGYRVLEAANGIEALRVWEEHRSRVALLLTDLMMPGGMTGIQLARRLLADKPNLGIVFTSGYSAEIAGRQMELRKGEIYVQKPCPPRRLLDAVRRSLDVKSTAGSGGHEGR